MLYGEISYVFRILAYEKTCKISPLVLLNCFSHVMKNFDYFKPKPIQDVLGSQVYTIRIWPPPPKKICEPFLKKLWLCNVSQLLIYNHKTWQKMVYCCAAAQGTYKSYMTSHFEIKKVKFIASYFVTENINMIKAQCDVSNNKKKTLSRKFLNKIYICFKNVTFW